MRPSQPVLKRVSRRLVERLAWVFRPVMKSCRGAIGVIAALVARLWKPPSTATMRGFRPALTISATVLGSSSFSEGLPILIVTGTRKPRAPRWVAGQTSASCAT